MNDEEKKIEPVSPDASQGGEATEEAQESANKAEEVKSVGEEIEKKEEKAQTPTPTQNSKKEVSKKLEDIISDIEKLSVLELADLVKALEEHFGVTAAAPMAVGVSAPAAAAGEAGEAEDEGQTSFNVILTDGGANKISVIKAVREIVPTLGLKEAKDLVDGAPKPVLEGAGKDAAAEAKSKLEAAGAKVELK